MEPPGWKGPGLSWWAVWVLWCVPAGSLAGVGLIEFNWGGPPYDGGFLGDLALFGGLLALGQAPFVAFFVSKLYGRVVERSLAGYAAAALSVSLWPLVGFVGWTFGSYFEVGFDTPLYSDLSVLAGVLPWLLVGTMEAVVFVSALAFVRELCATDNGETAYTRSGDEGRIGRSVPAVTLIACGATWVLASTVGGLFYEYWASFDVAACQNQIKDAIGAYLEGVGVAENVAYEVASNALTVPVLYGMPTGLALFAIYRLILHES